MKVTKEQLKLIIKEEMELFLQENPEILEEGWKDWAKKAALGAATIGALSGAPSAMAATPEKAPVTDVRGEFADTGPQASDIKVTKGDAVKTTIIKKDIKGGYAFVTLRHEESGIEATGKTKFRGNLNLAMRSAEGKARTQIIKQLQQGGK
jgi:hypothetical protein